MNSKKPHQSPESEAFNTLKGQMVQIFLMVSGASFRGKLVWVDHYTIGIEEAGAREEGRDPWIVYKHAIQMIRKLG